jgi:hypothetical protein
MTNPNPNYRSGTLDDTDADFDPEAFIEHVFDVVTSRRTAIRNWFERQGFTDVRVREVPHRGKDAYEVLAISNASHQCRTADHVFDLVNRLAIDLHKSVNREGFCAIAWDDRVGTQFRFRDREPQTALEMRRYC